MALGVMPRDDNVVSTPHPPEPNEKQKRYFVSLGDSFSLLLGQLVCSDESLISLGEGRMHKPLFVAIFK